MQTVDFSLVEYINKFEFVPNETPFSVWYIPIGTATTYLALVYLLRHFMQDREKVSNLGYFPIIHNVNSLIISITTLTGMLYYFIRLNVTYNWDPNIIFCDTNQVAVNKGGLYFWIYMFYLSKYYDLVDTFIIILRKGKLMTLHVWHHFITLILVWSCLQTRLPAQWSAEIINAFVHVPMYYYYLMSELKVEIWWKKYLTQLQILQFVMANVLHLTSFYFHYVLGRNCSSFDTWANGFGLFVLNSYLVLFIQFYRSSYLARKKK